MGIKYKSNPSLYEAFYILWNGIDFDKEKLIKFIKRLNWLKFLSFIPRYRKEYKTLMEVFNSYDMAVLDGLMNNDEDINRMALIEKYARIGALDIAIHQVFSRDTYRVISNLPTEDYKLILRRIDELVKIAQTTTYQGDNLTSNIPGT
jgi:hypothetical protein